MPNPWDIPPWPDFGDEKPDTIFRAVGQALSTWEVVEDSLADFFAFLVGPFSRSYPETTPAIRAYGSIISFNARCEMISAAAKGFFHKHKHEEFEAEFRTLVKAANGWASRRNDLAHGRVGRLQSRPGYFLYPGLYNSRKHPVGEPPAYVYNADEIHKFIAGFELLYGDLNAYRKRVFAWQREQIRVQLRLPPQLDIPPQDQDDQQ